MLVAGELITNDNSKKLKGEIGLVDQIRLSFVLGNTVYGTSPIPLIMGIQFWAMLLTPKP